MEVCEVLFSKSSGKANRMTVYFSPLSKIPGPKLAGEKHPFTPSIADQADQLKL